MKRIPPVEQTKEALHSLLCEGLTEGDPKSQLVRLAVRQIIEEALEGEARDALGREHYERRAENATGYRNGYREGHLKSSEGEIRYAVPQLRDLPGHRSAVREHLRGRTPELERLAVEMYARGCSTRDIESLFRDEDGRLLLSRTAVSEITERLWAEYEEFAGRDLSDIRPLYLFADGIAERLGTTTRREAVLVAWAITEEGKKVLVHLAPGTKESTECCREFFEDLKRRGLGDPVLVATDGAPGLIRAVEECFPASLRQRCLAHKMRNIISKLPESIRTEFRIAAKAAYEAPSPAMARALKEDLVSRFEKQVPTAVRCFTDDFEACIAHLNCPPAHRKVARTTNLLERLFLEERRRSRAANITFGERPVLKLMYAALIRGAERWRGLRITEFEQRQLLTLKEQLFQKNRKENAPAVKSTPTDPAQIYSNSRT